MDACLIKNCGAIKAIKKLTINGEYNVLRNEV